jgi:hypothetical protein
MLRCVPLVFLLVASCGFGHPQSRGSSVTIILPPPKAVPAPGFSSPLTGEAA